MMVKYIVHCHRMKTATVASKTTEVKKKRVHMKRGITMWRTAQHQHPTTTPTMTTKYLQREKKHLQRTRHTQYFTKLIITKHGHKHEFI